jgi:hypothetical protein
VPALRPLSVLDIKQAMQSVHPTQWAARSYGALSSARPPYPNPSGFYPPTPPPTPPPPSGSGGGGGPGESSRTQDTGADDNIWGKRPDDEDEDD